MTVKEKIDQLRAELHQHNYNYYVLNAPEISDKEFDDLMRELQDLEKEHPEYQDDNSPTMRVGSDLNKNFTQVAHKYPMLSLGNTYSENEVTDFYERVKKALNEDFEICCELKYDGTYLIGAFGLGLALITAVMLIPALHSIFQVQTLNLTQLLIMFGLSLANLPIIQFIKWIRTKIGK